MAWIISLQVFRDGSAGAVMGRIVLVSQLLEAGYGADYGLPGDGVCSVGTRA